MLIFAITIVFLSRHIWKYNICRKSSKRAYLPTIYTYNVDTTNKVKPEEVFWKTKKGLKRCRINCLKVVNKSHLNSHIEMALGVWNFLPWCNLRGKWWKIDQWVIYRRREVDSIEPEDSTIDSNSLSSSTFSADLLHWRSLQALNFDFLTSLANIYTWEISLSHLNCFLMRNMLHCRQIVYLKQDLCFNFKEIFNWVF